MRSIPLYHLESVIVRSIPSFKSQKKLSPEDDLDAVADEIIKRNMDEFCWSLHFDPAFLVRVFYSGFLPICTELGAPGDPVYCLLPKLHFQRCVVVLENFVISSKTRRKAKKYVIRLSKNFQDVLDACSRQHRDRNWLYPPFAHGLADLATGAAVLPANCPVRVVSVELVDENDTLVAGEIGFTCGSVYTSMTGFYSRSGCGSIQLAALGALLKQQGFSTWDLGMDMQYKRDMGAVLLGRSEWIGLLRSQRITRKELPSEPVKVTNLLTVIDS